jgi:hypothetical protein
MCVLFMLGNAGKVLIELFLSHEHLLVKGMK